jgi:hypothetical protein
MHSVHPTASVRLLKVAGSSQFVSALHMQKCANYVTTRSDWSTDLSLALSSVIDTFLEVTASGKNTLAIMHDLIGAESFHLLPEPQSTLSSILLL